ncbi:MAG: helicase-associated domain-containing protein [Beutenbergiaceae bacterium]
MASIPALTALLHDADDLWLATLLRLRPDLSQPVPASLSAMANRLATRASTSRAVASLDAPTLATLELSVVLAGSDGNTSVTALSAALGMDAAGFIARLREYALLLGDDELRPAPGVAEALGPTPLGLGPSLRSLGVNLSDGWPVTPPALAEVMGQAPTGARRLLEALTWGPPVGTLGTDMPPAAAWLLKHHVLHRKSSTEVLLPREIGIAARGTRIAPAIAASAPLRQAPQRPAASVAAEAVSAADAILRDLAVVVQRWSSRPRPVLRRGGVAARDVTDMAAALEADDARAALVLEGAAMVDLLGQIHTDDATLWAPTREAAFWLELPDYDRWSHLVHAWLGSPRVPWLAGTRTERGVRRAALDPDLSRPWASRLRREVLTALASWPAGAAPTAEQVREHLAWQTPRATPPAATISAVLSEATALGLVGAGALTDPGRAAITSTDPEIAASALAKLYPQPVSELIIQGDLTGIVPGRPTAELATLLDLCAEVENRGAALQVRFTAASIGRALEAGWSADDLLTALSDASVAPLPQPLHYQVTDTARRSRRVRIQAASSVIRVDDEAQAVALLADPAHGHLGLRRIGPATLAADASPMAVRDALHGGTTTTVLEDAAGHPLQIPGERAYALRPFSLGTPTPAPVDPEAAVRAMRAGELRTDALLNGTEPNDTRADLEVLRAAASRGTTVQIVVAGASGTTRQRQVRPLSVDSGRVRAIDLDHDSELTIAPHRIVSVRPI